MNEKFDPLDYWGRLAICLLEENSQLRKEILECHIALGQLKLQKNSEGGIVDE